MKGDGCNTNVISKSFFEWHKHMLNVKESHACISYCMKDFTKQPEHVLAQTTLELGDLKYNSNWVVSSLRYDITLDMSWHQENNQNADYKKGTITVTGHTLPILNPVESGNIQITNITVKNFRKMIRRRSG